MHFKSFPALMGDAEAQREVVSFIDRYTRPHGDVALPSGVHVIDFEATAYPASHLPDRAR